MGEFKFSEDFIRRRKRLFAIVFPTFVPLLLAFSLYVADWKLTSALFGFGGACALFAAILFIELPLLFRSMRKLRVRIAEDKIAKASGRQVESIPWQQVSRARITKDARKETVGIVVEQVHGPSIHLGGFEDMERIASTVAEKVPADTPTKTKQLRYRPDSPLISIVSGGATIMPMILVYSFGERAFSVAAGVFALGVGILLLLLRPMTKGNGRSALLEIILSVLMLFSGAGMIALQLLGWGL